MKKFMQIATAIILSLGFMGSVAGAASSCTSVTYNDGHGSKTTVDCKDITSIDITCENNTTVANISYQNADSGYATVIGDSTNGSATSGTVSNTNGTTTQLGVNGCGAGSTTGGGGTTTSPSVSPSTSVSPSAVKPKTLPNTSSNDTASVIFAGLAGAAAVVGLSRVAVAAYRRIGNN